MKAIASAQRRLTATARPEGATIAGSASRSPNTRRGNSDTAMKEASTASAPPAIT